MIRLFPTRIALCTVSTVILFASSACKTRDVTNTSRLASDSLEPTSLPAATQALWDAYEKTLPTKKLQDGCKPIHVKPVGNPRGLVVIYHGFTGCPQQFINVGRELADQGFHVLLPLLPGNGRVPKFVDQDRIQKLEAEKGKPIAEIAAAGEANDIVEDDFSEIPNSVEEYYRYAEEMTAIAKTYPGPRVMVGLSLGGGLAVATLIKGADRKDPGESNVWTRGLLITPFFRAPSIQGNVAPIAGASAPNFGFSFGAGCESGQLQTDYRKRIGICDFTLGQIRTLQVLGEQVARQSEMSKIAVPVQVIGVANDNTSDNTAIIDAFSFTDPALTRICFFPDEVNHAITVDGDFVPLAETYAQSLPRARDRQAISRFSRFWARPIQDQMISFISSGFGQADRPFTLSTQPSTDRNKKAKRCELQVDYEQVLQSNRRLCAENKALPEYCRDLDQIFTTACSDANLKPLPAASSFKQYCLAQRGSVQP